MDRGGPSISLTEGGAVQVAVAARERDGTDAPAVREAIMSTVIWDTLTWAERNFDSCELGDRRRNRRLIKVALQAATRPDASTPDQTETWAECKAAYRLFKSSDYGLQQVIAPHCRMTREACVAGDVKLIICDTTELDYTSLRKTQGLGHIGNGRCRGFFLHTALMLDDRSHRVEGLAGQEVFYRRFRKGPKPCKKTRRRHSEDRESAVWGRLIDRVGRPPAGVTWIHVCDRGADDIEVMEKARVNGCGFIIRASHLNRKVVADDGCKLSLQKYLAELPIQSWREIKVRATAKTPARVALVALRYGNVELPLPSAITPWLKKHGLATPMRVGVVELLEVNPPQGTQRVRWVLYSQSPVTSASEAELVIQRYEQRPMIEDFHKALKTGCAVEHRQYHQAERLERVAGLSSVIAIRLLELKTAALETPDRPAQEMVPARWIKLLQITRKKPLDPQMTIRDFIRQLAGLGGFLLRKSDGEPGWITLWRGFEKLQLIIRGADTQQNKCG